MAARIASKAAARRARVAMHRPKVPDHGLHKKPKSKKDQLRKSREIQDDGDVIVVKSRRKAPERRNSSSGRVIIPSKRLQK